ncbi:MAG: hypothetical protein AB7O43_09640 [Hyphomicrobiaceae bacterium]
MSFDTSARERPALQLAADLPFETIPTYPVLHFFARNGKVIAGSVAAAGLLIGIWTASSLGSLAALALGLLLGGFLGFVLLVLAELTRALADIMLPR